VSFNVFNFFTVVNSGESDCGPSARSRCRGADSDEELDRQLAKITTALTMIDADIVGFIELENNQDRSLQTIVNSLNAATAPSTYAVLETKSIGDDAIRTGFIFKPANVTPQGSHAILDSSVDARFDDKRNRPVLAQTFSQNRNDARLTVVVNHLKAKGSSCERRGDPNTNDGQANCNQARTGAAAAIADWLQRDPTASNDPDFLIIGDLNAHVMEDPLQVLKNAGFVNLLEIASGGNAYSYVFKGQSGALDHALASPSLLPQVAETIEWHINADEAPAHDYNLEHGRNPAIFDGTTPYRASDHDPVIIGLNLSK
jgi:predicted extracellular nuclease